MNYIFKEYLWKFVVIYLDDILIFSRNRDEHIQHVELILKIIADYGFKLNFSKCVFGVRRVKFLGFTIENGKMTISEGQKNKINKIVEPRNVSELRSIIGFLNFFTKWIPAFAVKIEPLAKRLKKNNFEFKEEERSCLEDVKNEILAVSDLYLPILKKQFILYADASGFGIGAALVQVIEEKEMM